MGRSFPLRLRVPAGGPRAGIWEKWSVILREVAGCQGSDGRLESREKAGGRACFQAGPLRGEACVPCRHGLGKDGVPETGSCNYSEELIVWEFRCRKSLASPGSAQPRRLRAPPAPGAQPRRCRRLPPGRGWVRRPRWPGPRAALSRPSVSVGRAPDACFLADPAAAGGGCGRALARRPRAAPRLAQGVSRPRPRPPGPTRPPRLAQGHPARAPRPCWGRTGRPEPGPPGPPAGFRGGGRRGAVPGRRALTRGPRRRGGAGRRSGALPPLCERRPARQGEGRFLFLLGRLFLL